MSISPIGLLRLQETELSELRQMDVDQSAMIDSMERSRWISDEDRLSALRTMKLQLCTVHAKIESVQSRIAVTQRAAAGDIRRELEIVADSPPLLLLWLRTLVLAFMKHPKESAELASMLHLAALSVPPNESLAG